MPFKAVAWILLSALALAAILLFNYWASFQPLSTLTYAGIVLAIAGVANVIFPFRFLGIRRRITGLFILAGGLVFAALGLFWPAPVLRVAHAATRLDEIMPEYQFSERHTISIHAQLEQVMQAIRESTFGDMRSLQSLLKVRGVFERGGSHDTSVFAQDKRILDAFAASGYISGGNDHEILMVGGPDMRARRPLEFHTLQEFADYRQPGAIKMAFDFDVQQAGTGWCRVTAETRVLALDDSTRRGMGRYWRLILPGSGLLRRQWLDGIKTRAETMTRLSSSISLPERVPARRRNHSVASYPLLSRLCSGVS